MASVKNLKKEINYVLGDILNIVYIWEMTSTGKPTELSEALVGDIYDTFDALMVKVNQKNVDNKKAHYKLVKAEFEVAANQFVAKVNELN